MKKLLIIFGIIAILLFFIYINGGCVRKWCRDVDKCVEMGGNCTLAGECVGIYQKIWDDKQYEDCLPEEICCLDR